MPTLVIDNVPVSLYDQIQLLAKARQRTPADTALEVLETAFRPTTPTHSEATLPQDSFSKEEACAPFTLPHPEGKPTRAMWVAQPLPQEPFLTEEICAPFTLPRPEGERVIPIEIFDYLPKSHDIPDTE